MRFLLSLLGYILGVPFLLGTQFNVTFDDATGETQTQIYTFPCDHDAEAFQEKYERIVSDFQCGAFKDKPLDFHEVQTYLAAFCTEIQAQNLSEKDQKIAHYVNFVMRISHTSFDCSGTLQENFDNESCLIHFKNPRLTQYMAEQMLDTPFYQRVFPDFRCVDKILRVLSEDSKNLGDRYEAMPFGEMLDFHLNEDEKRLFANTIGLLSDNGNPWHVGDVMTKLEKGVLERLLLGREEKLRWLLTSGYGHRPTYMYKGFVFRGFSSGEHLLLVDWKHNKPVPGEDLLIFFEHGLSPHYGRLEDGLLEKDPYCENICERNMSGRLTPTMNGMNPQSIMGHTLLYGNSCTLSHSIARNYASSELLSSSADGSVVFLIDLRGSEVAHYVNKNYETTNQEVNEEGYIPGNRIVGAWPMCAQSIFFPNPHWQSSAGPAFCTIPLPRGNYEVVILEE